MVDLTRIRSIKKLEEMKSDINKFLMDTDVITIYHKIGWGEEDYDADKEAALYLLLKIERRIESLSGSTARID